MINCSNNILWCNFSSDWWCSEFNILHHSDDLCQRFTKVFLWQIQLHRQSALKLHHKILVEQLIKLLMSYQLPVNESPIFCLCLLSRHINFNLHKIYDKDQLKIVHQNPRFWTCLIQPTTALKIETGGFGNSFYFMVTIYTILQKMIQIVLEIILSLRLLQ